MPNPLFDQMGGQNPMTSRFNQFMQQMRGQDPQKIIDDMVRSGKLSQQQLNAVQQRAQQMRGMFDGLKGGFGF